jgi:hypothetical protein
MVHDQLLTFTHPNTCAIFPIRSVTPIMSPVHGAMPELYGVVIGLSKNMFQESRRGGSSP